MVLKRNILSALSFLFNLFLVHSLDYDSCFEPFDVSCIKFSNENIIVVTHNIRCNETVLPKCNLDKNNKANKVYNTQWRNTLWEKESGTVQKKSQQ